MTGILALVYKQQEISFGIPSLCFHVGLSLLEKGWEHPSWDIPYTSVPHMCQQKFCQQIYKNLPTQDISDLQQKHIFYKTHYKGKKNNQTKNKQTKKTTKILKTTAKK